MVFIDLPRRWSDVWFGWAWFLTPSGGHEPPYSFWRRMTEAPLPAHAAGALMAWAVGRLIWGLDGWPMWWWIVALGALWQAFNVERRAYSPQTVIGEVTWRVLIAGIVGMILI